MPNTFQCSNADCTVAETGVCVLEVDPRESCSNLTVIDVQSVVEDDVPGPIERPAFHPGRELGIEDANALMASRYCHLVAILGAPAAGKTAALVSFYLLLGKSKLNGITFADSLSLMAFEQIARGAREWNAGDLPEKIVPHTKPTQERTPGFLHLRLKKEGEAIDMMLADVPGEWSDALVDRDSASRFEFLARADALWIVVDGREIATAETARLVQHRTRLLLERAAKLIGMRQIPVLLVVTRCDQYAILPDAWVSNVTEYAKSRGLSLRLVEIASFSQSAEVKPGAGIDVLFDLTLAPSDPIAPNPPEVRTSWRRQIFNYRGPNG